MGRIKYKPRSKLYQTITQVSDKLGERDDCTVKAVSILTDVPYETVHAMFEKLGRKKGKGTRRSITLSIIKNLGYNLKMVMPYEMIKKYPGRAKEHKSVTTHQVLRYKEAWADGNKYLLCCRSHVAAVVDGEIHDWSQNKKMRVYVIYKLEDAS
jgi:hypothetical protein